MKCPHCNQEGTAYYISGSGTASKVYGCKNCKKRFRTKIERPAPPLRWDEAKEVLPDADS
jgi:transposase-like protein